MSQPDTRTATVRPVEEHQATGKVAEIFADIKRTKNIEFVPRFWQVNDELTFETPPFAPSMEIPASFTGSGRLRPVWTKLARIVPLRRRGGVSITRSQSIRSEVSTGGAEAEAPIWDWLDACGSDTVCLTMIVVLLYSSIQKVEGSLKMSSRQRLASTLQN